MHPSPAPSNAAAVVSTPLQHHRQHPPSSVSSNRRRSTSSVFAEPKHLLTPPPSSSYRQNAPASDPARGKAVVRGGDSQQQFREVQQDAMELNGAAADDPEAREREEIAEMLAQNDWTSSEIALFKRLRRRGREPLLPAPWRLDFTTFPEPLYAPVGEQSFICALTPSMEFRGSQALQRLVNIGGYVRDRTEINPSAPVEPLIYQEIKNFLAWAEKDAEISISSILTVTFNRSKKGNSKTASERTQRKMKALAEEMRKRPRRAFTPATENDDDAPRTPTAVYGITVYNCVAAISSLSWENEETDVKTLLVLDWTDVGLDIWNAMAIAILIVTCRNDILDSDEEAGLKYIQRDDDDA
ncbi:hypothetical protein Dda_5852 [Drechslerella dactyloides]|uniref:Uncharacterized protein n=1 Tax=Drechslerella dactyloides TaxID=74499 RepID=A0AAD6IYW6_DREDA|nr:hypothetical protein Dda_5852 [Drechslerella dactyloides]